MNDKEMLARIEKKWKTIEYLHTDDPSDETRRGFKDHPDPMIRHAALCLVRFDETRLAFKDDPDASVREMAVTWMQSDKSRLAFRDDPSAEVRSAAVRRAKSDATRFAFLDDPDVRVREAAVSGAQTTRFLELAQDRETESRVLSAIHDRMRMIKEAERYQDYDRGIE